MARSFVVMLALCWLSVMASSSAADDDEGFGKCAPGTKHAPLPAVQGLVYDKARPKILAAGWVPRVTKGPDGLDLDGNEEAMGATEEMFWDRGYTEIDACAVDGLTPCYFHFLDKDGNRLNVYTEGEERPKWSQHPTVYLVELLCRR